MDFRSGSIIPEVMRVEMSSGGLPMRYTVPLSALGRQNRMVSMIFLHAFSSRPLSISMGNLIVPPASKFLFKSIII